MAIEIRVKAEAGQTVWAQRSKSMLSMQTKIFLVSLWTFNFSFYIQVFIDA